MWFETMYMLKDTINRGKERKGDECVQDAHLK